MDRFPLTTEALNEHGFWIPTGGIEMETFMKNPIMLYEHESMNPDGSEKLPIGSWVDITVKDRIVSAKPSFADNPQAIEVMKLVENGHLNAVSGGFKPIEFSEDPMWMKPGQYFPTMTKSRLKEASFVKFPGNLTAVRLYSEKGDLVNLSDSKQELDAFITLFLSKNLTNMKSIALFIGLKESATEAEILAKMQIILSERNDALIEMGKAKGAVNDKNENHFRKLCDSDYDTVKTLILSEGQNNSNIPPAAGGANGEQTLSVTELINAFKGMGDQQLSDDKKKWDYNDWELKDPQGLLELREKKPDEYEKLVKTYKPRKK